MMQRVPLAWLLGLFLLVTGCEGIDATKESVNQPRNLRASTSGDSVTISWTQVTRASQYTVYLSSNPDFQFQGSTEDNNFDELINNLLNGTNTDTTDTFTTTTFVNRTASTPDEHYTFSDLQTDTTYFFRVTATINGAAGPPSQLGQIDVGDPDAPPPTDEDSMVAERLNSPDQFSFTKLNQLGHEVPFLTTEFSCVRDNTSDLVWAAKSSNLGLFNRDDLYHWRDDNPNSNGSNSGQDPSIGLRCHLFSGQLVSQCSTQDLINRMNAAKVCGFDDWRLPRPMELLGLMNFNTTAQPFPSVPVEPRFFADFKAGPYWTDTPNAPNNDIDHARVVVFESQAFSTGHRQNQPNNAVEILRVARKNVGLSAIPVRGETPQQEDGVLGNCRQDIVASAPDSRFLPEDDGTVIDRYSGLMWSRCLGNASFTSGTCAIGDNIANREPDSLHGRLGWRLPNIKELFSIIELSCVAPSINSTIFPGVSGISFVNTDALNSQLLGNNTTNATLENSNILKSSTAVDGRDCRRTSDCDFAYGVDLRTGDIVTYNRRESDNFASLMVRNNLP